VINAPASLLARLCRHAESAYPAECCGLLVGRDTAAGWLEISDAVASANVTTGSAAETFEIDPGLRLRLARQLRGSGTAIIGHYHSHPDGPAEPSARDAAEVWEPDLVWMIVAVDRGTARDVQAFRFDAAQKRFRRRPLRSGL
jgi:proteasome lid subunit RPN8/RPN11